MCPTQESDEDGQFDRSGPMHIDSMSFAMVAEEIDLGYERRNVLKNVEARRSSLVEQGDFQYSQMLQRTNSIQDTVSNFSTIKQRQQRRRIFDIVNKEPSQTKFISNPLETTSKINSENYMRQQTAPAAQYGLIYGEMGDQREVSIEKQKSSKDYRNCQGYIVEPFKSTLTSAAIRQNKTAQKQFRRRASINSNMRQRQR